jgi:hypothetical protein
MCLWSRMALKPSRPPCCRSRSRSNGVHWPFMYRSLIRGRYPITAYSQVPLNTPVLAKTFSMKHARCEAEIPPHIEHHLYEMANPDFMHLGAAGLIQ